MDKQCRQILEIIRANNPRHLTHFEIAAKMDKYPESIMPSINLLLDEEHINQSSEIRKLENDGVNSYFITPTGNGFLEKQSDIDIERKERILNDKKNRRLAIIAIVIAAASAIATVGMFIFAFIALLN